MSTKRLQVLLDESEFARIRDDASQHGMTVSDWVRHALHRVRREEASGSVEAKLTAIEEALTCGHPTADIDQMLEEIAAGRQVSRADR